MSNELPKGTCHAMCGHGWTWVRTCHAMGGHEWASVNADGHGLDMGAI